MILNENANEKEIIASSTNNKILAEIKSNILIDFVEVISITMTRDRNYSLMLLIGLGGLGRSLEICRPNLSNQIRKESFPGSLSYFLLSQIEKEELHETFSSFFLISYAQQKNSILIK